MAEETTSTDGGQASTSGKPQAGTSTTDGQAPVSQTHPTEQDRIIEQLRKENALARVKAKELDDLKAKLEADKLSETEKLQKQIADAVKERDSALAQATALKVETAIQLRASQLGFADPDDASKLLDRSKVADDASNIDALLKDLLEKKPHLKAQGSRASGSSSGGATNPGRAASAHTGAISAEFVRNITREQYRALTPAQKDEVQQVMRTLN